MVQFSEVTSPQVQLEPLWLRPDVLEEGDKFEGFPCPVSLLCAGVWLLYSGGHVHMYFKAE